MINPVLVQPKLNITPSGPNAAQAIELLDKRRSNGKTYDLGGSQFQSVTSVTPIHYKDDPASNIETWKEIDLTIDIDGNVSKAMHNVSIFKDAVGYSYISKRGGQVDVELIEIDGVPIDVSSIAISQEGNQLFWDGLAPDLRFKILLRPASVELLKLLGTDTAPRVFTWRVREDVNTEARFRRWTRGVDALRGGLEMEFVSGPEDTVNIGKRTYKEFTYTETWTGRVSRVVNRVKRNKNWTLDAQYPVTIDASTQETIAATVDDGYSQQLPATTWFSQPATAYGTDCVVGYSTNGPYTFGAGVRFRTLGVPQGQALDSAVIRFEIDNVQGAPQSAVTADDVDDAALFANNNLPRGITDTAASVNFSPTATGLSTPAITAVVQEIISRPGWSSGNDIRFALQIAGGTGGNNYFGFADYDEGSNPARLTVTWTVGGRVPRYGFTNYQIPGIV